MNRFLENQVQSDCCGCSACVEVCPKKCLTMGKNDDGIIVPIISNKDACIECGQCSKVCPIENKIKTSYRNKYYGAYSDIPEDINFSASGGVFPVLARWVIEQGGVVYGAYLDGEHDLYHIKITEAKDIRKLQNSKYFQSEIRETYKTCQTDLQEGRLVLFTGTPCQVQGLKLFLKKDYENLLTADLICHGVPSKKMFDAYVTFLEKKHKGKLTDIIFRDKKRNGWSQTLRYTMEYPNGKRKDYYLLGRLSEYFVAFQIGALERESCYTCQFASMNRTGDISLGDFWGYHKKRPDLRHDKGLSLIISNSAKGEKIINGLRNYGACFIEVDEESVKVTGNRNIYLPLKRPEIRDHVYEELEQHGFEYIANMYFRKAHTWQNKLKNFLPPVIANAFKKKYYIVT